jgi:hypothetical protein
MNIKNITKDYQYFSELSKKDDYILKLIKRYTINLDKIKQYVRYIFISQLILSLLITIPLTFSLAIKAAIFFSLFIIFIFLLLFSVLFYVKKSKDIIKNKNPIINLMYKDKMILFPKKIQKFNNRLNEKFSLQESNDIAFYIKERVKLHIKLNKIDVKHEEVFAEILNNSSIEDIENLNKEKLKSIISEFSNETKSEVLNTIDKKIKDKVNIDNRNNLSILDKLEKNKIIKEI